MTTEKVELSEDERTTAAGLARYAFEYIEAARLVDEKAAEKTPGNMISPTPAYFLALHGIELTLKAYLRLKGVTVKELVRTYGHDIHACNRDAKKLGLTEIFEERPDDTAALEMLVDLNEYHSLRYIRTGLKNFPLWSLIESLAIRLHQAVAPAAGYQTFTSVYSAFHTPEKKARGLNAQSSEHQPLSGDKSNGFT